MMRPMIAVLLLACASSAAALDSRFAAGETLDFSLEWLHITAGSAHMTIGPAASDPTRIRITSIAESTSGFSRIYSVRDELESVVTIRGPAPLDRLRHAVDPEQLIGLDVVEKPTDDPSPSAPELEN